MTKSLYRSQTNRMLLGVCGGLGEYLNLDPTIVRLLWAFFTLITVGGGLLAYIIASLIIPSDF